MERERTHAERGAHASQQEEASGHGGGGMESVEVEVCEPSGRIGGRGVDGGAGGMRN